MGQCLLCLNNDQNGTNTYKIENRQQRQPLLSKVSVSQNLQYVGYLQLRSIAQASRPATLKPNLQSSGPTEQLLQQWLTGMRLFTMAACIKIALKAKLDS